MFAYLRGKLVSNDGNVVIIEAGGIGYEVAVSTHTANRMPMRDKEALLYVHLNINERNEQCYLYGFATREEKEMFLRLITISGIGPKGALDVLSGMELNALAIAIATGDVKSIAKIKNVGKKTAERIVLELKEKLRGEENSYLTEAVATIGGGRGTMVEDAVNALRTLGLTQAEALNAVNTSLQEADTLEELIMCALRRINK